MSDTEPQSLDGLNVAVFITPNGTEEPEFTEPKLALSEAGATVDVVGWAELLTMHERTQPRLTDQQQASRRQRGWPEGRVE